ncbi:MAG: hypothetical protein FWE47_03695 [Oscillospiraceae bacterium]|nr:hypothetical protein [Oscillospiraceae bacterium]
MSYNTTMSNAQANFEKLIHDALTFGNVVNIATDQGNVIMLSEQEYRDLVLTLEVEKNPEFVKSLDEARNSDDWTDESEVIW